MSGEPTIVSPSIEDNLRRNGVEIKNDNAPATEASAASSAIGSTNAPSLEERLKQLEEENALLKAKKPEVIEKILTEEEIAERKRIEQEEFFSFVTTEKQIKLDEYKAFEEAQSKSDRDIVYERYKTLRKEENRNMDDNEIQIDFEADYGLLDSNPKKLEIANKRIEAEAKVIRDEKFKGLTGLKEEFAQAKTIKAKADVYKNHLEATKPEPIKVTSKVGDNDISVDVDYTDIYEDLKKDLQSPVYFNAFTAPEVDTEKAIKDFITQEVRIRKQDEIINALVSKAVEGIKKNVKLGAVAPVETILGSKSEQQVPEKLKFILTAANVPNPQPQS